MRLRRTLARRSLLALGLITASLALAGTASAAIPSLEYVVASRGPSDSNSPKVANAICPPNTRVLGGGAFISGGAGQVGMSSFEVGELGREAYAKSQLLPVRG